MRERSRIDVDVDRVDLDQVIGVVEGIKWPTERLNCMGLVSRQPHALAPGLSVVWNHVQANDGAIDDEARRLKGVAKT